MQNNYDQVSTSCDDFLSAITKIDLSTVRIPEYLHEGKQLGESPFWGELVAQIRKIKDLQINGKVKEASDEVSNLAFHFRMNNIDLGTNCMKAIEQLSTAAQAQVQAIPGPVLPSVRDAPNGYAVPLPQDEENFDIIFSLEETIVKPSVRDAPFNPYSELKIQANEMMREADYQYSEAESITPGDHQCCQNLYDVLHHAEQYSESEVKSSVDRCCNDMEAHTNSSPSSNHSFIRQIISVTREMITRLFSTKQPEDKRDAHLDDEYENKPKY